MPNSRRSRPCLDRGFWRIPNYQAAYDLARRCFEDARAEWAAVADRKNE